MLRRLGLIVLLLTLLLPALTAPFVSAQSSPQALTRYALPVYSGSDRSTPIIGVLNPQAKIILEARNIDTLWVLGHSTDGKVRGWMESRFLDIAPGVSLPNLLVSNETMFVPVPETSDISTINLAEYAVVPTSPSVLNHAREIYEQGRILGMDPHVISKIGDCITDNPRFLYPFGLNEYNLGGYIQLQPVIDYFGASMAYDSQAAYDGLVTTAVLDPVFANPGACLPGESPLHCEIRIHRPSVAIIMFGAQDLLFTSAEDFDQSLRHIVHETIQAGVIPILSTFPSNLQRWDQSIAYNQIVVQVAVDYQIPLINLWLALESLPHHGVDSDGRHLSIPITSAGDLRADNLKRGYTLRNLITLEALDVVWRNAMSDE
jgi:hypothetical protein